MSGDSPPDKRGAGGLDQHGHMEYPLDMLDLLVQVRVVDQSEEIAISAESSTDPEHMMK